MHAGRALASSLVLVLALAACEEAELPVEAGFGPDPVLPPPRQTLVPTVAIAPATGWAEDEAPEPADGLAVTAFARGLDHPRWLHVLPNGDVLVAESRAPRRPETESGIVGWIEGWVMDRAGAGGESADRITLLRDTDGDGVADFRSVLLRDLNSPFGMALVGTDLYVADTDAVRRFPYREGDTAIAAPGEVVAALPAGPLNRHWTKSLLAAPDGSRLYVGVGSNSNVAENGLEAEEGRAAIWEIDTATGDARIFASGLRNPVGLDWEPVTGRLWTAVNERDELGSDVPPDYMTSVEEGGFYGWPWSWFGDHVDGRVEPRRPDRVAEAIVPDYALGAHTASLGLAFSADPASLPGRFAAGAFVGQHGSWNRRPRSGYQVIFVPFADGRPAGLPETVLGGFLDGDDKARGRPAGVVLDAAGALLVADDVGDAVWRVTAADPAGGG